MELLRFTAVAPFTSLGVRLGWTVRVDPAFTAPRVRRDIEEVTGAVLVAFGVRVATER
jgi:threonine/homoserine/homoserine lactone efflux protein